MTYIFVNSFLAVAWASLNGDLTIANLLGGFLIGYLMLAVAGKAVGSESYVKKVILVLRFFLFFLWELLVANLRVAWEVLTPGHRMTPAIVGIPLDVKSDIEILILANVITLTPGTLSLDVSVDKTVLYVHGMYVKDVEAFRADIKQGFERRILEIFNDVD